MHFEVRKVQGKTKRDKETKRANALRARESGEFPEGVVKLHAYESLADLLLIMVGKIEFDSNAIEF